jgi:hypothetical protein
VCKGCTLRIWPFWTPDADRGAIAEATAKRISERLAQSRTENEFCKPTCKLADRQKI